MARKTAPTHFPIDFVFQKKTLIVIVIINNSYSQVNDDDFCIACCSGVVNGRVCFKGEIGWEQEVFVDWKSLNIYWIDVSFVWNAH